MQNTQQPQDLEKLARKRAGAKLGWYIHAGMYIAVNLMFALIAFSSGRNWVFFPAAGWAVGLALHGAIVFFVIGGGGLFERLVQQERNRLQLQRDPW